MKRWSEAEVNKLVECVEKGLSGKDLQDVFPHRSYASIMAKKDKLGLYISTKGISEEVLRKFINDINRLCIAASEYCLYDYELKKDGEHSYGLKQNMTGGYSFCIMASDESEIRIYQILKGIRDAEIRSAKIKYGEYKKQYELSKNDNLKHQLALVKSCIDIVKKY